MAVRSRVPGWRAGRALAIVALTLGLAACPSARQPRPELPAPESTPAPPPEALPAFPGATLYRVVADQSLVRILVRRGGRLASAGHNHIIASRNLNGSLWVHDDLQRSGFQLVMPVTLLEVDDPDLRAAEGSEFPREVPQSAREGTRRNLLSEELLDGDRYPGVTLSSLELSGTAHALVARTRVQIKDQAREVQIPVSVRPDGDRLVASGEFAIRQSDFGITPFSILMGAVTVQDELQIRFVVVGEKE